MQHDSRTDPNRASDLLGGLSPRQFIVDFWQKKPLLVRRALPGYSMPLSPDELAGLACEPEVESRLVMETGGEPSWQLEHGPFEPERFGELPPTHWTLLVQEANKHVHDLALLLERFAFLPNWRLDDIMVSYAPTHGSVGPHADNYDVFLIQGAGRRRWSVNHHAPGPEDLVPDLPLRIMREFRPEQSWDLEPGDMLYLPPGVAHHGVALDNDCMTISVGFRAPNRLQVLASYFRDQVPPEDEERFYTDPDLAPPSNPGLIDEPSRARIRAWIRAIELDDAALDRWFGQFATEPRNGEPPLPEEQLDGSAIVRELASGAELLRSEFSRFAWFDQDNERWLFVDGEGYRLAPAIAFAAPLLSGTRQYATELLLTHCREQDAFAELLAGLFNRGALYLADTAP